MAYDDELAQRIRSLVTGEPALTEKRMFGGLAFLLHGNMAIAASREGGLIVRVAPAETQRLLETTPARPFETRGRMMNGWLRVDGQHVATKRELTPWVRRGVAAATSLPPKG
ncbi:MAG: TfoX/Sxy family protein [Acidobacteriota bacterium]|nr:TfoX/Sxy family protein [Acidobacteriota bacterium]